MHTDILREVAAQHDKELQNQAAAARRARAIRRARRSAGSSQR